jgi:hypothetical protein
VVRAGELFKNHPKTAAETAESRSEIRGGIHGNAFVALTTWKSEVIETSKPLRGRIKKELSLGFINFAFYDE